MRFKFKSLVFEFIMQPDNKFVLKDRPILPHTGSTKHIPLNHSSLDSESFKSNKATTTTGHVKSDITFTLSPDSNLTSNHQVNSNNTNVCSNSKQGS